MTDRYIRQDDVVFDTATGLEWQAEAAERMTWYEANEHAEGLGEGWELPTVEELATLVDYSRVKPATAFPDHENGYFWSSSAFAAHPSYVWAVSFDYGAVSSAGKNPASRVRCVRRGSRDRRFNSLAEAEAWVDKLEAERDNVGKKVLELEAENTRLRLRWEKTKDKNIGLSSEVDRLRDELEAKQ